MTQSGNRAANESDVTSLSNEHALDFDDDTLKGKDTYMYVYYQNGLRFNCCISNVFLIWYGNKCSQLILARPDRTDKAEIT